MRAVLLCLLLAAAGCATPASPAERSRRVDERRVRALADSLGGAAGAARLRVAERALAGSGVTPLADRSYRLGLGAAVGGFVPGRQPVARPALVVVGVPAGSPRAPAVLEAARLVAVRSAWELLPERTVLFVVWDEPPSQVALEATLQTPLWTRDRIAAVLLAGAPGPAPEAVSGVPLRVVPPGSGDAADVLRLVDAIVEAARPVPVPPDTAL